MTQAYLAGGGDSDPTTSKAYLYSGMQRAGSDGTTAFDYEMNQAPPAPNKPYVPNSS
jgi:hypothetical protein